MQGSGTLATDISKGTLRASEIGRRMAAWVMVATFSASPLPSLLLQSWLLHAVICIAGS